MIVSLNAVVKESESEKTDDVPWVTQNRSCARPKATNVEMDTQTRPGIMKEWLRRYLPMTVVPDRSKLTVAMSDG